MSHAFMGGMSSARQPSPSTTYSSTQCSHVHISTPSSSIVRCSPCWRVARRTDGYYTNGL